MMEHLGPLVPVLYSLLLYHDSLLLMVFDQLDVLVPVFSTYPCKQPFEVPFHNYPTDLQLQMQLADRSLLFLLLLEFQGIIHV